MRCDDGENVCAKALFSNFLRILMLEYFPACFNFYVDLKFFAAARLYIHFPYGEMYKKSFSARVLHDIFYK